MSQRWQNTEIQPGTGFKRTAEKSPIAKFTGGKALSDDKCGPKMTVEKER